MRVQYLVAALGALGLTCLGLSLWLQHGCARGKLPPGRRRACAALAVALGISREEVVPYIAHRLEAAQS